MRGMRLWFARDNGVTLREQLVTQVVLGILGRDLRPGQRLPSTREIARRFHLHPNTVNAGDYISVKSKFPFRILCRFVRATDDELVCSPIDRGAIRAGPDRIRFRRSKVREVRFERSDDANGAALGAIVGGTAATAAAINNPASRKFSGVIGGVMGFWIGETFGRRFHVLRGRIVYKR